MKAKANQVPRSQGRDTDADALQVRVQHKEKAKGRRVTGRKILEAGSKYSHISIKLRNMIVKRIYPMYSQL